MGGAGYDNVAHIYKVMERTYMASRLLMIHHNKSDNSCALVPHHDEFFYGYIG